MIVLKFILGEFCIVCVSFHTINFSMFYLVLREYGLIGSHKPADDKV